MISATALGSEPLNFAGKTVLVVGGSSGIGNGIAHAFLQRGAQVHVWGTRPSATDYVGTEGSTLEGLHYRQVDVTALAELESYRAEFERLDVLVLSQGAVLYSRSEFTMPGFQRVVDVNLGSVMACAIKCRAQLVAARGSMIIISSVAAFRATRGNPAYSASKAGVVALARTLAETWARDGVRVNTVAPGLVATKLTAVTVANPARLEAAIDGIPAGRLGTPEDIAGAVLFLASPLANYIVGQTIIVDGGATLS